VTTQQQTIAKHHEEFQNKTSKSFILEKQCIPAFMNKRLKAFEKQQHINTTHSFTNKQHTKCNLQKNQERCTCFFQFPWILS
jgi:hypothetical protein